MGDYFDWNYYINRYKDLQKANINTYEKAVKHWKSFGINETRVCHKMFENFNWVLYSRENNIKTKNECLIHYYNKMIKENPSLKVIKLNIIPSPINYNSIYNKLLNSSIYVSKNLTNIFKINNVLDTTKIKINTNLPLVNTVLTKGNNKLSELKYTSNNDIKLIICTCIYKRYELTKFCITQWLLSPLYKVIVVYSYDEDYNNLKDINDDRLVLLKYENLPLSNKWNFSVVSAKKYNPDAVMIMGSDDVFTDTYINKIKYYMNRKVDYISNNIWLNCWYFNNKVVISSEKYINRIINDGLGSGRVYSSQVLNCINWNLYLFTKPINKKLDGTSFTKISKFIKSSVFDIDNYSIVLLKIASDKTAITIKCDLVAYINNSYRTSNYNKTMDNINIIDYK
jgi:hypothetical protein